MRAQNDRFGNKNGPSGAGSGRPGREAVFGASGGHGHVSAENDRFGNKNGPSGAGSGRPGREAVFGASGGPGAVRAKATSFETKMDPLGPVLAGLAGRPVLEPQATMEP